MSDLNLLNRITWRSRTSTLSLFQSTLIDLEKHPATKIRFSKGFAFANLDAANEFDEQRRRFFHENERLDDYMEMCEGLDLVGVNFQEHMVAFAEPHRLPW
ncbi:transmembrane protein 151B [Caerostris darwini]|uniref:Transmembrane protein 151B n=1 Tax=Caerostris darwini TaxID=1538125 RepID=A0AAV4U0Q4_9ARAC|nr:transmembrane protein 151B [Caerostris darwini]